MYAFKFSITGFDEKKGDVAPKKYIQEVEALNRLDAFTSLPKALKRRGRRLHAVLDFQVFKKGLRGLTEVDYHEIEWGREREETSMTLVRLRKTDPFKKSRKEAWDF